MYVYRELNYMQTKLAECRCTLTWPQYQNMKPTTLCCSNFISFIRLILCVFKAWLAGKDSFVLPLIIHIYVCKYVHQILLENHLGRILDLESSKFNSFFFYVSLQQKSQNLGNCRFLHSIQDNQFNAVHLRLDPDSRSFAKAFLLVGLLRCS